MSAFTSFVSGRRTKWIVLAFWLAVAVLIGPLANKLQGAQKNDPTSCLPGKAESTKVLDLEKRFPGGETAPAVVIYRRDSGLTRADLAKATADWCAIQRMGLKGTPPPLAGPCPPPAPVVPILGQAQPLQQSRWSPPIPSRDGKAVLYSVPITAGGDSTALIDDVDAIREQVGEGGGGLDVKVTGAPDSPPTRSRSSTTSTRRCCCGPRSSWPSF